MSHMLPIGSSKLSYKLYEPSRNSSKALVVVVNGLRTRMQAWDDVAAAIADRDASVLCYDRWNNSESGPPPASREARNDLWTCAEDLKILLTKATSEHQLPEQTVLVGSSIGCSIIRLCLQRFQEISSRTTAIVFLDSYMSNTDFVSLFPPPADDEPPALTQTRQVMAQMFHPALPNPEGLSLENARMLLSEPDTPRLREGIEMIVVGHDPEHTARSMQETLGTEPALFLKYVQSAWDAWNDGLGKLSTRSKYLMAENSGHFIYRDRPDLVIGLVMNLVEANTRQTA